MTMQKNSRHCIVLLKQQHYGYLVLLFYNMFTTA